MKSVVCAVSLLASTMVFAPLSHAQSAMDTIIPLTPGQWENTQKTTLYGAEIPLFQIDETQCLTEEMSGLTVRNYFEKLLAGIGPDTSCEFSEVTRVGPKISMDISCVSASDLSVELTTVYTHSPERVDVLAKGTIDARFISGPVEIKATTQRVGNCDTPAPAGQPTP